MDRSQAIDLDTVRLKDQPPERIELYKYRDAAGREVITNDLAQVPAGTALEPVIEAAPPAAAIPDSVYGVHLASAVLGLAVGVSLIALPRLLRRGRLLGKLVTMAAIVVVIGGLYFGWVMRLAGFAPAGPSIAPSIADPRAAVDEAGKARDVANARTRAVEQIADQLDK